MRNFPSMTSPSGEPNPHPSTEKTYYQSRKGVNPTITNQIGFKNPNEDGMRTLYASHVMAYTGINGHEPTSLEKGVPLDQGPMGAGGNKLVHEKKFG